MECRVALFPTIWVPPSDDWWPALVYIGLLFLVLLIGEGYRRIAGFSDDFTRAYTQVTIGILVAFQPCLFRSFSSMIVLAGVSSMFIGIGQRASIPIVSSKLQIYTRHLWLYPLIPLLTLLLSGGGGPLFTIPMLVLSASFGCRILRKGFGQVRIRLHERTQFLEGMIAFGFVVFLTVHIPLLLSEEVGRGESLLIAVLCAALVVGFEIVSSHNLDSVLIPSVVLLALQRMMELPLRDLAGRSVALMFLLLLAIVQYRRKRETLPALVGILLLAYGTLTLGGLAWLVPLVLYLMTFNLAVPIEKDPTPVESSDHAGDLNDTRRLVQHFIVLPILLMLYVAWPHPAFYQAYMGVFCFLFALAYGLHGEFRSRLGTEHESMGTYFSLQPQLFFWSAIGVVLIGALSAFFPSPLSDGQAGTWLFGTGVGACAFLFVLLGNKILLRQYQCPVCEMTTTHPWCHSQAGIRVEALPSQMEYGTMVIRSTVVVAAFTLLVSFLASWTL